MTDRVLSVRLQMEVAGARQGSKALAKDLVGVAQSAESGGRLADRAMGRIRSGALAAGKAVGTVGGLAAGGLATLTAATVKGGIAYNTLEQTSRAALKTVLGSASAASGQMERLREFGKTSPFPRQIWISAQQQLLAFGMSAEKIIPTFEAIQDAVAAAGGGSQEISEITSILAKVQSTGKVTAETLNELGYRGIDAATLIGEAMGKTAAEVRADVTAQAITGVQFIDQLTSAMSTRFAGAAANVKETWAGATDRIKGAVRDIGGLLASPLVDPNGGGAAVEWANSIADALRALESRLEPAIAALRDRAEPAVQALNDKLQALAEWIRNADFSRIAAQLQPMLPAILGVTAGFVTMGAQSLPILDKMLGGLRPLPVALAAAAFASPELRQALFDLLAAAAPLLQAVGQLTTTLASALGPALQVVAGILQPVIAVVGFLADRFGDLPGVIQMAVVGFVAWKALGLSSMFTSLTTSVAAFNGQMKVQQALAAMSGQQIGAVGSAYSVAATKVSGATAGMRGAMTAAATFMAGPWGIAIGIAATALGVLTAAQQETKAATDEFTIAIDESTGALTGSSVESIYRWAAGAESVTDNGAKMSDVLKSIGVSADELTGYLTGNAEATRRVEAGLRAIDSETTRNYTTKFLKDLRAEINGRIRVEREAAGSASRYAGATNDAANAALNAAGATGTLGGSLYGVGDAADSVAARTQQLQTVLSGLWDTQFALQKASDDFQGGLHSLQGAFAGNDKAATKSAKSNEAYADSLKRQQKIARDTREQLEDLAEAQREAEKEAAEAAKNARQRALDELFGRQFDVQATLDQFRGGLSQAGADIAQARADKTAGATSLAGFSEGALSNRERMRQLVQQAQAVIQAERDRGASPERQRQLSRQLATQLGQQASAWGLNAREVTSYTNAIRSFGDLAAKKVVVDLGKVRKEFAEQRAEIHENSREQMENARQSATSAAQSVATAGATKVHTAALKGNSESAVKNRDMMRQLVKQAQDELTQMHLSGAGKEELTRRGEELADQLMAESTQLGFTESDVRQYTDMIKVSADEIARYPTLNARANVQGAMTTVENFVSGVNKQLAKIKKNFEIGVRTGSEYINTMGGGRHFLADGGFVSGQGGPREDKIPAMLSNGEYVVNARDTAKNLQLLEVINRGGDIVPGFARGGYVDPINLNFKGRPSTGLKQLYDGLMRDLMPGGTPIVGGGPALQWASTQAGKPYLWGGVGPHGYDCCLAPGTLVYGPDGATPIESVRAGDRVYSYVDGRLEAQTVTAQWQSKRQQVFKVRTRNRSVVGSANHPFLRMVQVGPARHVKGGRRGEQIPARFEAQWARLDELQPGDLLVQPRRMPTAVKPDPVLADGTAITEDIAWLIGAAVGDGTVTGKALRLCLFGEKRERADRIAREAWGGHPMRGDSYGLIISSVALARSLAALGMRVLGPDKQVPEAVWQWAPELQRAFLDGYCDADGHRPADQTRHGERTYSSCSRRLVDDVRALHIMLGDPVSNVTTNKRARPITIKGKPVKTARPLHTFAVWAGGRDGEAVFRRLPGLAQFLVDGDFTLARVLSIADEGLQDTYDLEVQGAHNFVADGVVVHNSGFMSAITNVIQGRNPYARRFATGNFPTGDFAKGPGNFMIGSFRGNPGHMAGTLRGVNVESRGGDGVVIGRSARGARDTLFGGNVWHLRGYADGGQVGAKAGGDPPFDLLSPRGMHWEEVLGSYAKGTPYVPMDGLYELHRGEAVVPADLNRALIAALASQSGGEAGPITLTATVVDSDGTFLGRMRGVAKEVVDGEGRNLYLTRGSR